MAAIQENWDEDFEFQVEKRTNKNEPAATENWDDDFEDSRQSPKKVVQRQREESWDDEDDDESAEFGLFAEEDRTVTARSRRAALARLTTPLPPGPTRSPTSSVFSVPTTIHTYSSTTHLRPTSTFARIPPSPPIHKERERRRLRKKSRPKPTGVFELMEMPMTDERLSFEDGEDLPRPSLELVMRRVERSSRSDLSSVDERPPVVTTAAAADTSIESSGGPVSIPATPTKGVALLSRIGSVKKWGTRRKSTAPTDITNESPVEREPVIAKWDLRRRKRGDSTTPADTLPSGSRTDQDTQAQSTFIASYLPMPIKSRRRGGSTTPADVISNDRRNEVDHKLLPRASSSLSSYQHQHQALPPALPPLPLPLPSRPGSSQSTSQLPMPQQQRTASAGWFFRSASKSSNNTTSTTTTNSELGSSVTTSSSSPSTGNRRSGSRSRSTREGCDGDANANPNPKSNPNARTGNTNTNLNDATTQFYSTRTPNASRTDLSQREDGGKTRKDSLVGNPKLATSTPTKLVKRKSFGFVHLGRGVGGHGGGENEAVGEGEDEDGEGRQDRGLDRYAGLGLGRVGDEQETPKRDRRRSLSRLLLDRDKEKEEDSPRTPSKDKEGARSFMGSVRRISLVSVGVVGRHRRAKSGGGAGAAGGGGSPASYVPPVPPILSGASQVSLRIPDSSGRPTVLQRAVSLSSAHTTNINGDPTLVRSSSGEGSRPSSVGSSSSKRRRRVSKTRPKSRKSEDGDGRPSLDTREQAGGEVDVDVGPKTPTGSVPLLPPIELKPQLSPSLPAAATIPLLPPIELQRHLPSSQSIPLLPPIELQPHLPSSQPAAAITLLPPIELQPPSPPRTMTTPKKHMQKRSRAYTTTELIEGLELDASAMPSASTLSTVFFTPTSSLGKGILPLSSPGKLSPAGKSPQSQQSVSLGRSTAVAVSGDESLASGGSGSGAGGSGGLMRRNSLGDLKIPARISQAQVGLRRDLGMVREFAGHIEQLKVLQNTYNNLVGQVQTILDTHQPQPIEPSLPLPPAAVPKPTSANFFTQLKARPKTRARSNTNPTPGSTTPTPNAVDVDVDAAYKSLVEAFWGINAKYRISWECAELLIELGSGSGGDGSGVMSAPATTTTSVSAPVVQQMVSAKGRERAITLVGEQSTTTTTPQNEAQTRDQSQVITGSSSGMQSASSNSSGQVLASPSSMSWQTSTGRHDLSQRQLVLLREMLNNSNGDERGLRPPISATEDDPESALALALSLSPSRFQYLNRDWRWGDARNSTITLSEEQEGVGGGRGKMEKERKRRSGRLGMSGIRDMLRSLKKSHADGEVQQQQQQQQHHHHHHGRLPVDVPMMHSTTSLSTESSMGSRSVHQPAQAQQNRLPMPRIPSQIRRRGRSSTGPESMRSNKGVLPTSFTPSSFTTPKPSNRRPSLASIFRIGSGNNQNQTKTRPVSSSIGVSVEEPEHDISATQSVSATTDGTRGDESNSTGEEEEEEDWDRMDSASDLEAAAAKALGIGDGAYDVSATVRGRSGLKNKMMTGEKRKKGGVSPYLQDQFESSYEIDQPPPPVPSLPPPASSSSTGLGGFLARHSIIPKRSFSASRSSIWGSAPADGQPPQHSSPTVTPVPSRLSRPSNFEEQPPQPTNTSIRITSSKSAPTTGGQGKVLHVATVNFSASGTPRPPSRPSSSRSTKFPSAKTGSVRSMPPHLVGFQSEPLGMIMTPENIKPLLENAKEVRVRLDECIAEMKALVEDGSTGVGGGLGVRATLGL